MPELYWMIGMEIDDNNRNRQEEPGNSV
jgi:hypothetical protein